MDEDADLKRDVLRVVKRFIRAVTRLFVILCIETSPMHLQLNLSLSTGKSAANEQKQSTVASATTTPSSKMSQSLSSSQLIRSATSLGHTSSSSSLANSKLARLKSLSSYNLNNLSSSQPISSNSAPQIAMLVSVTPLSKCEYVLKHFAEYAVSELADVANSLIGPVILGMSKPTTYKVSITSNAASSSGSGSNSNDFGTGSNANNSSGSHSLAEELFNLEPTLPRQFASVISTSIITSNACVTAKPAMEAGVDDRLG